MVENCLPPCHCLEEPVCPTGQHITIEPLCIDNYVVQYIIKVKINRSDLRFLRQKSLTFLGITRAIVFALFLCPASTHVLMWSVCMCACVCACVRACMCASIRTYVCACTCGRGCGGRERHTSVWKNKQKMRLFMQMFWNCSCAK